MLVTHSRSLVNRVGGIAASVQATHPMSFPASLGHQADELDDAVDLHFFEHAGAVFGDGLLADAQLAGDLLRVLAGHQQIEHFALPRGERFDAGRQFGLSAPTDAGAGRRGRWPLECASASLAG